MGCDQVAVVVSDPGQVVYDGRDMHDCPGCLDSREIPLQQP